MRRIVADRNGTESPVPTHYQSTVRDFRERSLQGLGYAHDSIIFSGFYFSMPPVLRRSLRSRIV